MQITITLKSFSCYHINITAYRIKTQANKHNIKIKGPIFIPKKKKLINLLRSPHADKDSRDQITLENHKILLIATITNKKQLKWINDTNINPIVKTFYKFNENFKIPKPNTNTYS